jgi:hypothetical protein
LFADGEPTGRANISQGETVGCGSMAAQATISAGGSSKANAKAIAGSSKVTPAVAACNHWRQSCEPRTARTRVALKILLLKDRRFLLWPNSKVDAHLVRKQHVAQKLQVAATLSLKVNHFVKRDFFVLGASLATFVVVTNLHVFNTTQRHRCMRKRTSAWRAVQLILCRLTPAVWVVCRRRRRRRR